MPYLHLLSEDDQDDLFYESCLEKITGVQFTLANHHPIRKGGGISEVRKALPAFINRVKGAKHIPNSCFLIALDSDRAPDHFDDHRRISGLSKRDLSKQCRVCEVEKLLTKSLGSDRSKWPTQGMVVVPIQMLETWALLGCDPTTQNLPLFSSQNQSTARSYYSGNPPPQLKDLLRKERLKQGFNSHANFLIKIASNLDLDAVSTASPSFAAFRNEVAAWKFED